MAPSFPPIVVGTNKEPYECFLFYLNQSIRFEDYIFYVNLYIGFFCWLIFGFRARDVNLITINALGGAIMSKSGGQFQGLKNVATITVEIPKEFTGGPILTQMPGSITTLCNPRVNKKGRSVTFAASPDDMMVELVDRNIIFTNGPRPEGEVYRMNQTVDLGQGMIYVVWLAIDPCNKPKASKVGERELVV